mgnify:CR=1 FL=1
MKLSTRLFGQTYNFKNVKEVLAKANEPRSGDVLAGVAAQSSQERIAAKHVLSELTLADLRENPVIPYEEDCVTRIIQDGEGTLIAHTVGAGKTFTGIAASRSRSSARPGPDNSHNTLPGTLRKIENARDTLRGFNL